jgi:hypothetical protein
LGILGVSFESLPLKFMLDQSSMSQDAVLGGDNPAPLHSLVLGGLGGLQQRFETGDEAAKLAALQGAIAFGDEAIGLLSQALTAESLQVRAVAYALLKQMGSEVAIVAAGVGIPLKVGDRIYGVYESIVSYGDDWYYISSAIDEEDYHEEYPLYHSASDANGAEYCYVTDAAKENQRSYYGEEPKLWSLHVNQAEAENLVEKVYKQRFFTLTIEFGMINRDYHYDYDEEDEEDMEFETVARFDMVAWCERYGVEFSQQDDEEEWNAQDRLLKQLHDQKREDLLYDIWPQLGYRPLAFVHEYEIDRPCYLKLTKV